ncbi:MAG: hypothetical protein LBB82_01045 [Treponema sp.]|jgi:histidinol dehydrogenase|nr:hypothetical protein [Treponema sp.]
MKIGSVADHRSREGGALVYPVYSRRSGGLSAGVNLFPDHKLCSFDCPYCEVFPFESSLRFDLEIMKSALRSALNEALENRVEVRDICFSGNGEPTLSADFRAALEAARIIRDELFPAQNTAGLQKTQPALVVITNGTGLLDDDTFELLRGAADCASGPANGLSIWLKLDAATEAWYRAVNRSPVNFAALIAAIKRFAQSGAPFILQTMICLVERKLPPPEEESAWIDLVTELAALSHARRTADGGLRGVHLYGKARPAPEDPRCEKAPGEVLLRRADLARTALSKANLPARVEVFE